MARLKTRYVCSNCGYTTPKWWGICPRCRTQGTLEEEVFSEAEQKAKKQVSLMTGGKDVSPINLKDVEGGDYLRFTTGIGEFDRVLGGGIVDGSLVLIGGDPGIGKSTILLQLTHNISKDKKVLYVSAEESLKQIKLRADRLFGGKDEDILIMSQTNLEIIETTISKLKPQVVIIDSIQTISSTTLESLPGSVSQVKDIANRLMKICKSENICCFIVGHVTKDGAIAGPRVLEHLVDTVLYFEGEKYSTYRMIRAVKNRFGSTNELGVFEMTDKGLIEVDNPSKLLISDGVNNPGVAVACTVEGTRPMLVEIQSLVISTNFPSPRRTSTGTDFNRLNMLLAVLEKYAKVRISSYDVYVNLAGGIRITEPYIDAGIVLAVASSYTSRPVKPFTAVCAEVGLTGELRRVSFAKERINEAQKMGFETIVIPKANEDEIRKLTGKKSSINIIGVTNINSLLSNALEKSSK